MRLKINLKSVLFYVAYAFAAVLLNCVIPGIPLSLGVCFSLLICGANIIATPLIYALSSIVNLDWITCLLSIFECGFLTVITLIYRRTRKKIRAEAVAYLAISLTPFIALSRWKGTDILFFIENPYIIKAVAAAVVAIFALFAFKSVYALMFRAFRCRLCADELICLAVSLAVTGIGLRNVVGLYPYVCICAGVIPFFVRLLKSPAALIVACVLAAPCAVVGLELSYLTAFILITLFTLAFCELGRYAPSIAAMAGCGVYTYLCGGFSGGTVRSVIYGLLIAFCSLLAMLPTENALTTLRDLLAVKKALPRAQEERFKEYVSDKLFKMSEVFREIECAFTALDEGPDKPAVKRRMLTELKQCMCADCKRAKQCAASKVYKGFAALIEAGCLKGKVSLVDLTAEITANCNSPAALIDSANRLLYEYRKLTLEAENAKSGRRLLAGQARGVAEVLKSRAVELCRSERDYSALERKIVAALAAAGISCPEIRIRGDANPEISLILIGLKHVAPVISCIERVTNMRVMLRDKLVYDGGKCAYVFVKPPEYDAAFGVAYAVKDGEKVSGDTHSVIRINEHSFLMALSDGMGSGEYARRVSSTAISLIEAFYRSEMPTDVVLDTINKLLCFNRDERFTCIDAAAIDLNTLSASFIKIGAPVGIIVRKGEIKVLESHSLPLGILDNLHPATAKEQLKKDDIVVFMSDGVTSCFDGVSDLYGFVERLKPLNPQSLAEKILAAARERVTGVPDDMTVLCVRIFKAAR